MLKTKLYCLNQYCAASTGLILCLLVCRSQGYVLQLQC